MNRLSGLTRRWWSRATSKLRATRAGLRHWWRRARPTAVGLETRGAAWAAHGTLRSWPLAPPRRAYQLYVPAHTDRHPLALLVWIHGCRQSVATFRDGTGIRAQADARGIMVLMPEQSRLANPVRCWNWFDSATAAGRGEVALIQAQIQRICDEYPVDPNRIWVAGLSSGAALAATLALHAPTRFAAIACHSGLAAGAARNVREAQHAMSDGPQHDVNQLGLDAMIATRPVPTLVIQGGADQTVAPVNADGLISQVLGRYGERLPGEQFAGLRDADRVQTLLAGKRSVLRSDWLVDGHLAARKILIDGLGHAWSGGDAREPYFDADGPDASALILDFFERYGRAARKADRECALDHKPLEH